MMKAFILLTLFAAVFAEECGENQSYKSCGTACPLTCKNYQDPPKACILMCNPGCHCDEGFVKTEDERCVRPEECPANATCGLNERYVECGTACPLFCDILYSQPIMCPLMCKPGCQCEPGFVRAKDGRCMRPEECLALEPTVAECLLKSEPGPCRERIERYFYNSESGKCEKFIYGGCGGNYNNFETEEECRDICVTCGLNERWNECATACPLTCDNMNNPPIKCPLMCKYGCECEPGFVRAGNGRCVRAEECPAKAPTAETCLLQAKPGLCRGYFPRYFYNSESGQCEQFIYGGCGGNENNFETLEACHNTCGSS